MLIDRYHRQVLLPQIGAAGQARLGRSGVLLVGCGALGGVIAEQLVRAGVGAVRIVDRDVVELTNLQRQVLFDEKDVAEQKPKSIAAAEKLRRINSGVSVESVVADVHAGNVEELAGLDGGMRPVDLIMDGTDNVDTRYLINDVAVKHGIPWIYGACVGTEGRSMAVRPGRGPCLRCIFPEPPSAAELPTCDTAGVLGSAATLVASLQVVAACRVLLDQSPNSEPLISVDLWQSRFRTIATDDSRRADCKTCGRREFEFLESSRSNRSIALCGRNAVQLHAQGREEMDLARLALKLSQAGQVQPTPYLVRCDLYEPKNIKLTIFPDGRAIVQGTSDFDRARSIYSRFVGS